jgi:hypothetical protein
MPSMPTPWTTDADVRRALRAKLREEHSEPGTRIIEELGLGEGIVRIDVAVVNGQLLGYEIKSDRDTLDRLPDQAALYNAVFDEVVLVTGKRHRAAASRVVPRWWGVVVAEVSSAGDVLLTPKRKPRPNRNVDPGVLVRLLWREEALQLLEQRDAARGFRSKPRADIYAKVLELLPPNDLRERVREILKLREGWRSAESRASRGDASRFAATSRDFLRSPFGPHRR